MNNLSASVGSSGPSRLATPSSSSRALVRESPLARARRVPARDAVASMQHVDAPLASHQVTDTPKNADVPPTKRRSVVVRAIYSQARQSLGSIDSGNLNSQVMPTAGADLEEKEEAQEYLRERRHSGKFATVAGIVRHATRQVLVERNMVNFLGEMTRNRHVQNQLDKELAALAEELGDFQCSRSSDGRDCETFVDETSKTMVFFNQLMREISEDPNLRKMHDIENLCGQIQEATRKVGALKREYGASAGRDESITGQIDTLTKETQLVLADCLKSCQGFSSALDAKEVSTSPAIVASSNESVGQLFHADSPNPVDIASNSNESVGQSFHASEHANLSSTLVDLKQVPQTTADIVQPAAPGTSQSSFDQCVGPPVDDREFQTDARGVAAHCPNHVDPTPRLAAPNSPISRLHASEENVYPVWAPPSWVANLASFRLPSLTLNDRPADSPSSRASLTATPEEFLPTLTPQSGSELLAAPPHPHSLKRFQRIMATGCRARPRVTVERVVQHREQRGTRYSTKWRGVKYDARPEIQIASMGHFASV